MKNLNNLRLYSFTKDQSIPFIEAPRNLAIRRCNIFQYKRIKQIWTYNRNKIKERLRRGDQCYLGYLDKNPAHYSWVQTRGTHFIKNIDLSVPIDCRSIIIYHCRTAEDARGKNIYPLVLQHIIQSFFQTSMDQAWIYTSEDNVASQKGILKAGFTPVIDLQSFLGKHTNS